MPSSRISHSILRRARVLTLAATALAGIAAANTASAGYTGIKHAPHGEAGIEAILEHTYGGDWSHAAIGKDWSNSSGLSAVRVGDTQGMQRMAVTTGDLGGGDESSASDASWTGGTFTARAVAKFSMNTQSFGITDSSGFHRLFTARGLGWDVTSGTAKVNNIGEVFKFERTGNSGTQTSFGGDNLDGRDHMITYRIDGTGADGPVYLLFWEDLDKTPDLSPHRSSSDFNDLVVELRASQSLTPAPGPTPGGNGDGGGVSAAPLPAPGMAGAFTLGGILLWFGVKRARRIIG